jgi:hypothetical protein
VAGDEAAEADEQKGGDGVQHGEPKQCGIVFIVHVGIGILSVDFTDDRSLNTASFIGGNPRRLRI